MMKTFVVGTLSMFDNELNLEIVEAENELEAIRKIMNFSDEDIADLEDRSLESIKRYMGDCDYAVNAICIDGMENG